MSNLSEVGANAPVAPTPPKGIFGRISISKWIIIAMVIGIAIGWAFPESARAEHHNWAATDLNVLSNIFLRMIKSLIVPLIASTLIVGIAGHGDDMKRIGKLALRSILYFEVVTTLALAVGLIAVNIVKPGVGIDISSASAKEGADLATNHATFSGVIEHTVPTSFFDAASKNEVLQIVFYVIIFAGAGRRQALPAELLRSRVRGDVQVREHRDVLRADRHRRGDRRHGVEERA